MSLANIFYSSKALNIGAFSKKVKKSKRKTRATRALAPRKTTLTTVRPRNARVETMEGATSLPKRSVQRQVQMAAVLLKLATPVDLNS